MMRAFEEITGAQVLRLFVANLPDRPDCVMFQAFRGGEVTDLGLGLELKMFGLGPARKDGAQQRYSRFAGEIPYPFEIGRMMFEDFLQKLSDWVDPAQPLWIHLDRPKGDLSLVPWERLIAGRVSVPVMRWPYHVLWPEPRSEAEAERGTEIVLCSSVPKAKGPIPVEAFLESYARTILEEDKRHRVHIFVDYDVGAREESGQGQEDADLGTFGRLQDALSDPIDAGRVVLYDPRQVREYAAAPRFRGIPETAGSIENPWLSWIADTMDVPVDMVHFLCHGYLAGGRGSLAFAESPLVNRDRSWARFVGGAEITAFLEKIGAWSVGFSSPFENFSEAALWALADEIAEARPGPVLAHDLSEDDGLRSLTKSFHFLFGKANRTLPETGAVTLYGHPRLLAARADETDLTTLAPYADFLQGISGAVGIDDILESAGVPAVKGFPARPEMTRFPAAASRRFIERATSRLINQETRSSPPGPQLESLARTQSPEQVGRERALSFVADLLRNDTVRGGD